MCQTPIWTLVQVLAAPLPLSLTANLSKKTAEGIPHAWAPSPVGDLDQAPGFRWGQSWLLWPLGQ